MPPYRNTSMLNRNSVVSAVATLAGMLSIAGRATMRLFRPDGPTSPRSPAKAPVGPGYERANRKEPLILDEVEQADLQLFAETHSLPGDILLQREYRIDPARFLQVEATCADLRRAQWRLRIMDVHQYNVGWRADGSWVLMDWAGVCRPHE